MVEQPQQSPSYSVDPFASTTTAAAAVTAVEWMNNVRKLNMWYH